MYEKTLVERDGYRAVLELDEGPDVPHDDGAVPCFTAFYDRGWEVGTEQNFGSFPERSDDVLKTWDEFRERFGRDEFKADEAFSRYYRIFHGVEYVRVTDHNGYSQGSEFKLFQLAPVKWCEEMGLTGDKLRENDAAHPDMVPELVSYAIGDAWVIVVQEHKVYANVNDPEDTHEEWDTVGACGGYYGDSDSEYFVEAAEELMNEYMPDA